MITESLQQKLDAKVAQLMELIDDFGREWEISGDDRKFTNNDADVVKARSDVEVALRTELAAIAHPVPSTTSAKPASAALRSALHTLFRRAAKGIAFASELDELLLATSTKPPTFIGEPVTHHFSILQELSATLITCSPSSHRAIEYALSAIEAIQMPAGLIDYLRSRAATGELGYTTLTEWADQLTAIEARKY